MSDSEDKDLDAGIEFHEEEPKDVKVKEEEEEQKDERPKKREENVDKQQLEKAEKPQITASQTLLSSQSSDGNSNPFPKKTEILGIIQSTINPVLTASRTLSEDRHSKDSAIAYACAERKKDSFNQVKAWDDRRLAFLKTHKNTIDDILSKIDKRTKVSQESMVQINRFFKERRDQESAYSKVFATKVPPLSGCWKDPTAPEKDPVWYPLLSQAFKETDAANEVQSKNVQTLVLFLEKNVIKELLLTENEDYDKKIKTLRSNVADQQERLEKSILYTTKKSGNYTSLYTTMIISEQTALKLKKMRKDLLNVEIKFRQAAFDHIREEKDLGQAILTYWEESRKLECVRINTVQKAFQLYITKHQDTYGVHPQMQKTLLNFKNFDTLKETGDNFSISKILSSQSGTAVRKSLGINDNTLITWPDILRYVVNFTFKDISISQHPLVQKKFKIFRDVGSVTKSFRECWMVATVDDILLFYDEISEKEADKSKGGSALTDGGKKVNNQPKKKFILDYLKAKPREDPQLIDIIEKTPGLLFDSTNKQLIKFMKDDDFEEFKVFMMRYADQKKPKEVNPILAASQV